MKQLLKINFFIVLLVIFLIWITLLIGFPWLKGCEPSLSCPSCESCITPGFPRIINFYSLPFVFVLYLVSAVINNILEKTRYHNQLKIFLLILIFILVAAFYYHQNWRGQCRAFPMGFSSDPRRQEAIIKCPSFYNPFRWEAFQLECEQEWKRVIKERELEGPFD